MSSISSIPIPRLSRLVGNLSVVVSRLLVQPLVQLSPAWRQLVLVLIDLALLPLACLMAFLLLEPQPLAAAFSQFDWVLPGLMTIGLALYLYTGQYKGITRYTSGRSIYALALRNLAVVAGLIVEGALFLLPMPPFGFWGLLWFLLTGFTSLTRFLLQDLLHISQRVEQHHRVVIYGAGGAGAQLAASLLLHPEYRIVAFIDDDPELWNRHLHGVMVTSPSQLPALRQRYHIDLVMLAMPSISRSHCRQIVRSLQEQGLSVLQVPSLDEISSGKARIDAVRPVAIEDLLGRDQVSANPNLLAEAVTGRSVLVSGAGGSIGSELCRQILKLRPRKLLLLEISEPALYEIDQELKALQASQSSGDLFRPEIVAVLGSVLDGALLERVFGEHRVHVVFHAAAYKHVPLVEMNPMAGLNNNVLGTRTIAEMAVGAGVEHFLMISTDKAVRPTNVMGASKRLAELVVQGIARRTSIWAQCTGQSRPRTNFALVRFGNVLGSSGSVVPLFKRQIAEGGPITLTHPEIIRYFMTIPEAVQLVLQASALAQRDTQADPQLNAEAYVFLLDMGEPVRILDLARQMVRLSGLSLRDADNPGGDIEIKFTGLRPGEKLYEELLISGDAEGTGHPLIFRAPEAASDHFASDEQLWPHLDELAQALDNHELSTALELLAILVPEWSGVDGGNEGRRKTSRMCQGNLRVLQTPA